LTGFERLIELAVKKMFMKESIILSLADADDFTIDFQHVLALAYSFDFNFWFHRSRPLPSQMPRISEKWAGGDAGPSTNFSDYATSQVLALGIKPPVV
jgi:hypothetical protein